MTRPEITSEAGGWSVFLTGVPVAADGANPDDAVEDFVAALREYADDWDERLSAAPNHARHQALVQLVHESTDADLTAWVRAGAQSASGG